MLFIQKHPSIKYSPQGTLYLADPHASFILKKFIERNILLSVLDHLDGGMICIGSD